MLMYYTHSTQFLWISKSTCMVTDLQRSCGKVIFSLVFVCPKEGRVSLVPGSFQEGRVSVVPGPFLGEARVSGGRVYRGIRYRRGQVSIPYLAEVEASVAVGTHPTGMLSCSRSALRCFENSYSLFHFFPQVRNHRRKLHKH